MLKSVLQDLFSDVLGGAGITTISIPFVADVTDICKLACSIGGVVLVCISVNIKVILYREIKERNKKLKDDEKPVQKT